jgi:hypothetical protein
MVTHAGTFNVRHTLRLFVLIGTLALILAAFEPTSTTAQFDRPPTRARVRPPAGMRSATLVAPELSGATVFYTTTIAIPTYPYEAYLTEGYDAEYHMTYPVLDWDAYHQADPRPSPRDYELLVLENDYLKVTLLPELGGRVYQLIDKSTGQNQLYQNPVIKPTRWGPPQQGWWLAVGGIEWCLPVEEHGYEWGIPWDWEVIRGSRGITVTVSDTQTVDRLRAHVSIFLPSERATMAVAPRIENPTTQVIDYKFWLNAALAPGAANQPTSGLAFIFNAPRMTLHSTGDPRLTDDWPSQPSGPAYQFTWPLYRGVDYSRLSEWENWLGFFEHPYAPEDFIGVYDHTTDRGVVRVFPHEEVPGTKGFGWGLPMPWFLWTDEESGGVELHGGVAPTFWDTASLAAGETKTWREVWYPFRALDEISDATHDAVMWVYAEDDTARIDLQVTSLRTAEETEITVLDRNTCETIAHWPLPALLPTGLYRNRATIGDRRIEELAVLFTEAGGNVLASYGPETCAPGLKPGAHLGYGINVRKLENLEPLVGPLGFDWVKLWDEYSGLPEEPLDFHLLYNVGCGDHVWSLETWGDHVSSIAQSGKGKVDAYEICNEPNVRNNTWGNHDPDPARFTEMLCIAHDRIKAVDPDARVISGGLAPVGRLPCQPGEGCDALDERLFLQQMLDGGAGACIDGFGYHPYGFAFPPEQDPDTIANGFTFRGAEKMHEILSTNGWHRTPIWATEFNWIRRPAEDGREMDCDTNDNYAPYFLWQEVSARTQADYLVRAFAYADRHWPWMAGMFVWNTDWHDYMPWIDCFHCRYYGLRRDDGTALGASTPAYNALAAMEKRPGMPDDGSDQPHRIYLPVVSRRIPTPSVDPTGPSKIGVHAIGEGGTLEFVRAVRDGGGHVALVKGLSFSYLCHVKAISPETVTIGRWSDATWETVIPEGDPVEKAETTMREHMERWKNSRNCVDYWEVLNEVDPHTVEKHAWLGAFYKAAMDIAEANGYKLALFSYSMGVPELYEWQAIAETGVFARAQAGGHILSLHEYGEPLMRSRWGEPMPQYPGQDLDDPTLLRYPDRGVLTGRYRHLYRDILIPRGEVIPLAITETNLAIEDPEERARHFVEEIGWYDDRLREDDYVIGMAIFTLGGMSGWGHFDYYDFIPELTQRIVALADE